MEKEGGGGVSEKERESRRWEGNRRAKGSSGCDIGDMNKRRGKYEWRGELVF